MTKYLSLNRMFFSTVLPYYREVDLARRRLSRDSIFSKKIASLRNLSQKKQITTYIQSLRVPQIDECDALFLIQHHELLQQQTQKIKYSLIDSSKVNDPFVLFLMAQVFNIFDHSSCINSLLIKFNQQLMKFNGAQLCFCLQAIYQIENAKSKISKRLLRRKLKEINNAVHSMEISYHLLNIGILFSGFTNKTNFERWMNEIQCQHSLSFKTIYFLHELAKHLEIDLSADLLKRIKERMIFAIRGYEMTQFQPKYLVFLLEYYPQFAACMSKATFSPNSYVDYLEYLKLHPQSWEKTEQKIPQKILQNCSKAKFKRIIELQIQLGLANQSKLVHQMKQLFNKKLYCVQVLIQHLLVTQMDDYETWIHLENVIIQKFMLNHKFRINIFQEYELSAMFRIFSMMFKHRQNSVNFCKCVLNFFSECTLQTELLQGVTLEEKPLLINSFFQLIGKRIINQISLNNIIQFTVDSLQTQKWSYYNLKCFASTLQQHKIGEGKLWILMERQIFMLWQEESFRRGIVNDLIPIFKLMRKASFEMLFLCKTTFIDIPQIQIQKKIQNDFIIKKKSKSMFSSNYLKRLRLHKRSKPQLLIIAPKPKKSKYKTKILIKKNIQTNESKAFQQSSSIEKKSQITKLQLPSPQQQNK